MSKPTTIRLSESLLRNLDRRAKAHGRDRATFLRELLGAALARDLEDEVFTRYAKGELSMSEAAERLQSTPWDFFARLRARNATIQVTLEDWLDAQPLLTKR